MPIFKRALDLSFLNDIQRTGSGMRGVYYSNFPKKYKDLLKAQLGQIDPSYGIKIFDSGYSDLDELLAIHFISPELNKIGIKCPQTTQPLSIPNFMQHRYAIIKHFDGKHLDSALPFEVSLRINNKICAALRARLLKVGVKWGDCHIRNYLISHSTISELSDKYYEFSLDEPFLTTEKAQIFANTIDINKILDSVMIVDMGAFSCDVNSEPGQKINAFKKKVINFILEKNLLGDKSREIVRAFNEILNN